MDNAWSDWCLSPHPLTLDEHFNNNERGLRELYEAPQAGGRARPDGKQVKWRVAFPRLDLHDDEGTTNVREQRGKMPFWCEDVTDRSLRVHLLRLLLIERCMY